MTTSKSKQKLDSDVFIRTPIAELQEIEQTLKEVIDDEHLVFEEKDVYKNGDKVVGDITLRISTLDVPKLGMLFSDSLMDLFFTIRVKDKCLYKSETKFLETANFDAVTLFNGLTKFTIDWFDDTLHGPQQDWLKSFF